MIRVALFGVVFLFAAAVAAAVSYWLAIPTQTPIETIVVRFPEGWENAPVVEYKKPEPLPPWPSAVPDMSADDFEAAVTALERLRPQPRPPQPANAVLSDAQIASMKDRLRLTAEQEPYWHAVEESLRLLAWERRPGQRPRLDTMSMARVQEAIGPFVATLSTRQRTEIQLLAHIAGLRLDLSAAQ